MFSNKYVTLDENILTLICAILIIFSQKKDIFFAVLFSSIFSFINIFNESYFLTYSCFLCVAYLSIYSINIFTSVGFSILYASIAAMGLKYINSANDIFIMNITLLLLIRICAIISNYLFKIVIACCVLFILVNKLNGTFFKYIMEFL